MHSKHKHKHHRFTIHVLLRPTAIKIQDTSTHSLEGAYATGLLRNLSRFSEIKQTFVEDIAILVLIKVVGSRTFVSKENAIGCFSNLAFDNGSLKFMLLRRN
jgi:hypothetical protein